VHVSAAYFLVVTGLDLVVPLGAGISFFYLVPVVFLALWSSPKQSLAVMRIAAFSSILIAVGFLLSPPGVFWYAVTNRSYAFIVIGATVMLSVVRKGTEEDLKMLQHFPDIVAEPATKASTKNPLGFFGQPEGERAVLFANGPTFSVSIHSPTPLGHQTNVSIPIRR
jgi:hypothetical protein